MKLVQRRAPWKVATYFLFFILLIIVNSIGITIFTSSSINKISTQRSFDNLDDKAHLIKTYLQPADASIKKYDLEFLLQWINRIGPKSKVRITAIAYNGVVLGDSQEDIQLLDNHANRPEFQLALKYGEGKSIRFSESIGENLIYQAISLNSEDPKSVILCLSKPQLGLKKVYLKNFLIISIITLCILLIAVCLVIVIVVSIVRPLVQLGIITTYYSEGDFSHHLYIDHPHEMKILSKAFNSMAKQLQIKFSKLDSQKNELETVINSISDSLILLDSQLRIKKVNLKAEILLKSTLKMVENKSIIEIIHNTDLFDLCQEALKSGGKEYSNSIKLDRNTLSKPLTVDYFSKNLMALKIHISQFRMPNEEIHLLLILSDVTRLRKLQKIRTEFISNLSHELKTPVTSIRGYAEILMKEDPPQLKQQKKFLERIHNNAIRLTDITNDILSLSRIESNEKNKIVREEFQPTTLLNQAAESITRNYPDVEFSFVITDHTKEKPLMADSGLILMVFINLMENSVRYRNLKNDLYIKAEIAYLNETQEGNKKGLRIKISDNGMGVEVGEHKRIFERFYRTDRARKSYQKGTGLGLSIVNQIMRAHSGLALIESTIDTGTCITLEFPSIFE